MGTSRAVVCVAMLAVGCGGRAAFDGGSGASSAGASAGTPASGASAGSTAGASAGVPSTAGATSGALPPSGTGVPDGNVTGDDASPGPAPDGGGEGGVDEASDPVSAPPVTIIAPANSVQPSGPPQFCLCTRRDALPAGMCPRGAGQSVTMTIGPAGGTVSLSGQQGQFVITIPPMALASPTAITVTETAIPPPPGFVDDSPIYRIDPVDVTFSSPATLAIPFSNGKGVSAFDQNLAIYWSASAANPYTLTRLRSSSVNAGFMQGATLTGGYAIVGYASPGNVPYCM